MDLLLFHHEDFRRLYNCSFYNVERIPLAERRHPFIGFCFIFGYSIFFCLYALCLFTMVTTELRRSASYKLMINLGIIHLVGLQLSGLYAGWMALEGGVFCSHPIMEYITGGLASATWCASTLANLILAVNRCCELYNSAFAQWVFGWPFILLWLAAPQLYLLILLFYTKPAVFNSKHMGFFFNAHMGYFEDYGEHYLNMAQHVNNVVSCCTEITIYGFLVWAYKRAVGVATGDLKNRLKQEKRIYLQVILVGLIHFITGILYVIVQFIPMTFTTILIATIFYLLSQGVPALIYLTVNNTIRNTIVRRMAAAKARACATFTGSANSSLAPQTGFA